MSSKSISSKTQILLLTGRYNCNCTECQFKTEGMGPFSWLKKVNFVHKTRTKKRICNLVPEKSSFQAASNIFTSLSFADHKLVNHIIII